MQAVSYTLLKREVHDDQVINNATLVGVEHSVEKEYDLMKWIVGVLIVGILGILVTVVMAVFKRTHGDAEQTGGGR